MERLAQITITDEHIASITEIAAKVRGQPANADFTLKRQLIEMLNIWVTLAVEDGEKVIYLHWYAHEERFVHIEHNHQRFAFIHIVPR